MLSKHVSFTDVFGVMLYGLLRLWCVLCLCACVRFVYMCVLFVNWFVWCCMVCFCALVCLCKCLCVSMYTHKCAGCACDILCDVEWFVWFVCVCVSLCVCASSVMCYVVCVCS